MSIMDVKVKAVCENSIDEFTAENLFTDLAEDIGYGIMGSINFLKHLVTFDMTRYYDSRINTELKNSLLSAKRRLVNNKYDFRKVMDVELHVAVQLAVRQSTLINFLEENIVSTTASALSGLEDFNSEVGKVISSSEVRERDNIIKDFSSKSKLMVEKQVKLDGELASMLGDDSDRTLIHNLVANGDELKNNIFTLFALSRKVNEKDLAMLLSSIKKIKNRMETLVKLHTDGELSADASNNLSDVILAHANNITLVGKMYHVLYEAMQININISEELV